jgi:CHAT domain-containing protein/tetratricopeptide (TPR) repeat protein
VNVLVHQHEIDIAVEAGGVVSDSSQWDYESVYVVGGADGRASIRLRAAKDGPSRGRYRVRIGDRSGEREVLERAARMEAEGRLLLEQRTPATLPRAVELLEEAVGLWQQVGDSRRVANGLQAWGIAEERLGRHAAADRLYERARVAAKGNGDAANLLAIEKTWMNLGGRFGEERASLAELRRCLDRSRMTGDRRMVGMFTNSVGSAYGKAGNVGESVRLKREYLGLARELGDTGIEAEAIGKLGGLAFDRHDYTEMLRLARESLGLAQRRGDQGLEISALGQVALAHAYLGDSVRQAAILQRLRKLHRERNDLGSEVLSTVLLAGAKGEANEAEAAWGHFVEAAEGLLRYHAGRPTVSQQMVGPAEADLLGHLATFAQRHPAYTARAFALADSVRGAFLTRKTTTDHRDLLAALGRDTTAIEFVGAERQNEPVGTWLLAGGKAEFLRSPERQVAADLAKVIRSGISRPDGESGPAGEGLQRFGRWVLGPLQGKLRTRVLVVVPDESMTGVPFGLLPHPDYDDGSTLGDHHVITYAPSAYAIAARPREAPLIEGGKVLIAGDPVTNLRDSRIRAKSATAPEADDWTATARAAGVLVEGSQLPRLGFASSEAREIEREIGNRNVTKLLGFAASRERVMEELGAADFAQLIVHGLADLERPRGSGLAFSFWDAEGRSKDGFLRFEEIAKMRLRARLVTLSACDTSVGRVVAHYGVPSLANAFLHAGARRVVSTLWQVDDAATAELMKHFYRNLFSKERMLPAEALWRAQIEIKKQPRWRHPYYWAGFVLSGDWRPL